MCIDGIKATSHLKRCSACLRWHDLTDFYQHKRKWDGRTINCRWCIQAGQFADCDARETGIRLSGLEWYEICRKQNHCCANCGIPGRMAIDHIIPRHKGGSCDASNAQGLCKSCNCKKHTLDNSEAVRRRQLEQRPQHTHTAPESEVFYVGDQRPPDYRHPTPKTPSTPIPKTTFKPKPKTARQVYFSAPAVHLPPRNVVKEIRMALELSEVDMAKQLQIPVIMLKDWEAKAQCRIKREPAASILLDLASQATAKTGR